MDGAKDAAACFYWEKSPRLTKGRPVDASGGDAEDESMMKLIYVVGTLMATGLTALSCGDAGQSDLAGSSWTLTAIGDGVSVREVATAPPVELEFLSNGVEMAGATGCNAYSGVYEREGDSFPTVELGMQEAGCPTQELFERERQYKYTLPYAESATLAPDGSQLIIKTGDGRMLIFGP